MWAAPEVPCIQIQYDQKSGHCLATNICNVTLYGYVLCDSDVLTCGDPVWGEGISMCPHAVFDVGTCKTHCGGLGWNNSMSPCQKTGSCTPDPMVREHLTVLRAEYKKPHP